MRWLKRAALIFTLCIAASIGRAFLMLILLNLSGTATVDPFGHVWLEGEEFGGAFGIISFPSVYLATRKRRLSKVVLVIRAIVVSEIVLMTPLAGLFNLPGAIVTLAIAFVLCVAGRLR